MTPQKRKTHLLPYFMLGFLASFMELALPGVIGSKTSNPSVPGKSSVVTNKQEAEKTPDIPPLPTSVAIQTSVKKSRSILVAH